MNIEKDRAVFFHYTLTDASGDTIEDSRSGEPLGYLHGHSVIIPGLERELEGKSVGDQFEVTVEPAQAYGDRDEELVQEVPDSLFEGVEDVEVGMQFRAQAEEGERLVTVTDVEGDQVTIDANHPLAGERLHFDVEVTEVRPATEEELRHGHIHGEGDSH